MKKLILLLGIISLVGCKSTNVEPQDSKQIVTVKTFTGQQVTGISLSDTGRMFANFPRWRKGVENSVVEVSDQGVSNPYPNKSWNTWEIGKDIQDSSFVGVQSVIAFENDLYVLDTRNPQFKEVLDNPRIFVFDLKTDNLKRTYVLPKDSFHQNSYINDLRIDNKNHKAYLTDSGHAGLIMLDLNSGEAKRVLNDHPSTLAETDHLMIDGKKWVNKVNSDGIALDTKNGILYYHALSGYSLYSIKTDVLINGSEKDMEENVKLVAKTSAPDGMILDKYGNLYLADLEDHSIMKFDIATKKMSVFAKAKKIRWADTFSIYNNYLYFTNSRINEISGPITTMEFDIDKISLD